MGSKSERHLLSSCWHGLVREYTLLRHPKRCNWIHLCCGGRHVDLRRRCGLVVSAAGEDQRTDKNSAVNSPWSRSQ